MSDPAGSDGTPWLRVVSGDPTAEELAALTAVLAAGSGQAVPPPAPRTATWADPAFILPDHPIPGPDTWWSSALAR